eukprot:CAMPEP_0197635012 /NCGR_PEP_ID=MMETSP1338-20131121/10947_1 /TAXON_ID=43686 ORGANISM="Pelagodinium beii, Strain RCC1491" /NCGR_SAMPLE_ID=MMETSP1338 /ASSEMBLY_ACC=CAM_ASM_000754 /LENGTH=394 /DNA_ID=CAMNT_0043206985 /DNA_START=159 /DNA_END=1343 /DNA_ORIENTATION=+
MTFDDIVVVERIKSSLQALYEKQMMMNATMCNLGIPLGEAADPFASSMLFTEAFEFTWPMSRSQRNPQMVMMDPGAMPVMQMKPAFAANLRLFEEFKKILPDIFSEKRSPMPKARWKDLWNQEPSSVSAMERQIMKMVEQAFWALGADAAVNESSGASKVPLTMEGDNVPFEDWMFEPPSPKSVTSADSKKMSNRKKKKKKLGGVPSTPSRHPVAPQAVEEEDEEDEDEVGTQENSEPLCSDDEIVHGVFHTDHAHPTGISTQQTAASTPACSSAAGGLKGLPPLPHQPSASMQPRQLVCYIWNQTSQFPNQASADSPAAQPYDGFSRGAWMDPSQPGTPMTSAARVVVKNSFIDIDDPSEQQDVRACRTSRSLSPSFLSREESLRDDYWHGHV